MHKPNYSGALSTPVIRLGEGKQVSPSFSRTKNTSIAEVRSMAVSTLQINYQNSTPLNDETLTIVELFGRPIHAHHLPLIVES